MNIDTQILSFLKLQAYEGVKPLLLGCSGGPDSLALLLAIVQLKRGRLFVAHIDHGWRSQSSQEAKQLEELCRKLEVPFFLKTLDSIPEKNIEDNGRQARLSFFKEIYQKEGCQALLLGHHADDRAETILKRLFEGASLSKISGLRKVSQFEDMVIWRPLLDIQKKDICRYIESQNACPFIDATNLDERFLRGRMRSQIFPLLNTYFGKNITQTLNRFAEKTDRISAYLEERMHPLFQNVVEGLWGTLYDFGGHQLHPLECEYIAEKLSPESSHQVRKDFANFIYSRVANKTLESLYIDRGRVVVLKSKVSDIQWSMKAEVSQGTCSSWKDLCKGEAWVSLPQGDYTFESAQNSAHYARHKTLDAWWTEHQVPALFRSWKLPVVVHKGMIVHEFLTGKQIQVLGTHKLVLTRGS